MSIKHIAFYGTLMHNCNDSIRLGLDESLSQVGKCLIPGKLYDCGRYPALRIGDRQIEGELYKIIDQSILTEIDKFESHDDTDSSLPGFTRMKVDLIYPLIVAWVYYYDVEPDASALIISNRWAIK